MAAPNSILRVSLVQTDLVWENPAANMAHLEEQLQALKGQSDVIILPEMFSTGFSINAQGAEPMGGPLTRWMQLQAERLQALVMGSLKIKEEGKYYNRMLAVYPNGKWAKYDKKHLFRMGQEGAFYHPGNAHSIIEYKSWKIALFICYDLRFPVWIRNRNLAYDLAVFTANWPASRSQAWSTLLSARAIENLAFVAGVNRIGTDGNDITYEGQSAIYDYKGETLGHLGKEASIQTFELSKENLSNFRAFFPAHLDADGFSL